MPHDNRNEDYRLAEGCKKQEASSQKRLFEKYYGMMLSICIRYTKTKEDARDILQDGFAKAFSRIEQYSPDKSLYYWLRSIMINTAIDRYRAENNKSHSVELEENDLQGNLDEEMMTQFNTSLILKAIQTLPARAQHIFNLYVIEGYSHKEIAEMLNINEGTCRSQLNYAKKVLRKKLSALPKKENDERRTQ